MSSKFRRTTMPRHPLISLIFIGVIATLPTACGKSDAPGLPGGQAASKIAGQDGKTSPPPVEIWEGNRLLHTLRWEELSALPTHSFNTGMDDAQTGYAFVDALKLAGVTEARSVMLYGRGLAEPVRLSWKLIANPANQILLGVTHKNTMKVVANNVELLNRDRWVRHLYKIQVQPSSPERLSDDSQAAKMAKHPNRQMKGKQP